MTGPSESAPGPAVESSGDPAGDPSATSTEPKKEQVPSPSASGKARTTTEAELGDFTTHASHSVDRSFGGSDRGDWGVHLPCAPRHDRVLHQLAVLPTVECPLGRAVRKHSWSHRCHHPHRRWPHRRTDGPLWLGTDQRTRHGIPEAMERILVNGSRVQPRLAILKPISSAVSIGTGGSCTGREGAPSRLRACQAPLTSVWFCTTL